MDKFLPLHLKKKFLEENRLKLVFDVFPGTGDLDPKEEVLVAVMFTPEEEVSANTCL